ncbi:Sensor histidine kinase TmoS [Pirellula sp. SH-Sr6A]|uniref:sensor histidine kinase n=1 Tax=Pirellula sp. SH-Sr6A TaxID=1632865 RepID=UPI00078DBC00|nr:ATP-binding protein [Pirellula sp. SH-Sr6A]AMV33254.1 Sensor histidine kinase TmoS [Pirellula sp. SH-Sr6A]
MQNQELSTTAPLPASSTQRHEDASSAIWLEELQSRLMQVERLAAVGELTSTTTHEFNNLLMTIINYAKMGLRYKDEPTREKAFTRILDAANRGAKITSTVLGLSRSRPNDLELCQLGQLVEDTLVLLEREMQKYRIYVEMQLDEVPPVFASPSQIQRLLLNLLTNARQAIGENGTIRIKLALDKKTNSVALTIRDSGCGIPPEQLPRIFEAFYTTKKGPDETGKGGTGLGLSVCREIVENHKGRIRVESTVGKGTAFSIRIPVAETTPEMDAPQGFSEAYGAEA